MSNDKPDKETSILACFLIRLFQLCAALCGKRTQGEAKKLFIQQIIQCLGTNALAVYEVLVNIGTVVQYSAYSAGQAAQSILSINYGGPKRRRIRPVRRIFGASAGEVFF